MGEYRDPRNEREIIPPDQFSPSGRIRRSWQNETWNGPAPIMRDPFDEPENAPELKKSRSDSLEDRNGNFWKVDPTMTGDNSVNPDGMDHPMPPGKKEKKHRTSVKGRAILSTVLITAAAIIVLRYTLFNITRIHVTGNRQLTPEQITEISGIRLGDNLLLVNENDVQQRIESDYRLQFSYMEKTLPGVVKIAVREREACCWLSYCGINYIMDKKGIVLYESENVNMVPASLPEIKGLSIRNIYKGQKISLTDASAMEIYENLFLEMRVLTCVETIQETDLSNRSSLCLKLRDGYIVQLGNAQNLHAKLRAMLLVREELLNEGLLYGTINVEIPENPIYTPN